MQNDKGTISVQHILAELDGLSIRLMRDGSEWKATAHTESLGDIGGFPSETYDDAIDDLKYGIERSMCEALRKQLTDYQIAALLSALRVDESGWVDSIGVKQQIPMTVSGRTLERLAEIGLVVCLDHPRCNECEYPGHRLQGSGYRLTEWGERTVADMRPNEKKHVPWLSDTRNERIRLALGRIRHS